MQDFIFQLVFLSFLASVAIWVIFSYSLSKTKIKENRFPIVVFSIIPVIVGLAIWMDISIFNNTWKKITYNEKIYRIRMVDPGTQNSINMDINRDDFEYSFILQKGNKESMKLEFENAVKSFESSKESQKDSSKILKDMVKELEVK
jgi:hypothetical protein